MFHSFFSLSQSWNVLVSQTESLSRIIRKHSEDLMVGPLSKLTLLIRDKQQLRKTYGEQWSLLNQDMCRVSAARTSLSHNHSLVARTLPHYLVFLIRGV